MNQPTYLERCTAYVMANTTLSDEDQVQVSAALAKFSQDEYAKRKANATVMPFGKYKNKTVKAVLGFDKQYLQWLTKQEMMDNYAALRANINALL
jgi:hypothetical protein